jgi:hypothetical protein
VYSVETDDAALDQVAALPANALKFYAELLALLEITPWTGSAYNEQLPDANMRTHTFGAHEEGMMIYLVLEEQRRVVVLRVLWLG